MNEFTEIPTKQTLRRYAATHADEIAQISQYRESSEAPDPGKERRHKWLDENGWDYRTSYMMYPNGDLYSVNVNIGKARDGRKIIYAFNYINGIGSGKVGVTESLNQNSNASSNIPQSGSPGKTDYSIEEADSNTKYSIVTDPAILRAEIAVWYNEKIL